MLKFAKPTAGQGTLPKLVCPAESDLQLVAPRQGTATPRAGRVVGIAQRLAVALGAWRERRRARRRLDSWLTMDGRTLADIGLRPADVQAMVYAGAGGAQLADRGGRWTSGASEKVIAARRQAPRLRVVAGDGLDAAA